MCNLLQQFTHFAFSPYFHHSQQYFPETEDSQTIFWISTILAQNALIAMLSKIWILLERLAGLNPSQPKSPSTFISTHRWHTSGILHRISANVLIDTCVALCRQSEETLCNILSLNYRESQQRRNNIALHWNCCYMAWHANTPWALFRSFATASDPDWSQMASTGLMLPFWSHFEPISVFEISHSWTNLHPQAISHASALLSTNGLLLATSQ